MEDKTASSAMRSLQKKETKYENISPRTRILSLSPSGLPRARFQNAKRRARAKGIKAGMIRPITLWPFPKAPIFKAAERCSAFMSVELNMGQMIEDVELSVKGKKPVYFCGRTGGMIPTPEEVLAKIEAVIKEVL